MTLVPVRQAGAAAPPVGTAAPPLVLVGHGSRDPRSSATMRALALRVATGWAGPVSAAFLDFDPPSVPGALRELAPDPAGDPVVVPALLTRAYHGMVDLPEALRAAGRPTRLARVLGPGEAGEAPHPLLVTALLRRVSEVDVSADGLALLAAGTSDAAARSTVEQVAVVLAQRLHVPCAVGYASASQPSPAQAMRRLREAGARTIVGAAYFLAPGRLYDAAMADVLAGGAAAVAAPLGAAPEVAELVRRRARSVIAQPM